MAEHEENSTLSPVHSLHFMCESTCAFSYRKWYKRYSAHFSCLLFSLLTNESCRLADRAPEVRLNLRAKRTANGIDHFSFPLVLLIAARQTQMFSAF